MNVVAQRYLRSLNNNLEFGDTLIKSRRVFFTAAKKITAVNNVLTNTGKNFCVPCCFLNHLMLAWSLCLLRSPFCLAAGVTREPCLRADPQTNPSDRTATVEDRIGPPMVAMSAGRATHHLTRSIVVM